MMINRKTVYLIRASLGGWTPMKKSINAQDGDDGEGLGQPAELERALLRPGLAFGDMPAPIGAA